MNHRYEIYVCYTPKDNEPGPGENQGWVSGLTEDIENRMGQILGRKDIFSVQPVPEMRVSLERADFLVIILSREFLKSGWCDLCDSETDSFLKIIEERTSKGSRVYIAELDNMGYEEKPAVLRNIPGYRFWCLDKEGRQRILGHPKPAKGDQDYLLFYRVISDLTCDLSEEIRRKSRDMRDQEVLPEVYAVQKGGLSEDGHVQHEDIPEKGPEMPKQEKVFICHADEDREIAEKLFDDLTRQGIKLWMESRDLCAGENKRVMIRQAIKSACFFIALLSCNSITRGDFNRQQGIALEMLDDLPQSQVFVIPVRADDCDSEFIIYILSYKD